MKQSVSTMNKSEIIGKNMIKIRKLTTIKEFEDIEKEVDALIQENDGSVIFLTFDYLISWLHAFGKDDISKLQILIAENNNKIVGLSPMIQQSVKWRNRISLKVIKFIGQGLWGYADFLILNEFRGEVIEAFLDYLLRECSTWDRLELGPIPEDSLNIDGIRGYFRKIDKKRWLTKETSLNDAPYIDLKDIGDFHTYKKAKLKKKLLSDVGRCIRRLNELGTLEYGKLTKCNQFTYLDSYLGKFFLLHQKEWKDSRFSRIPQYKNLYREFASRALRKGFFELSYLCLDDDIIACHYGFVLKHKLYYFTPVYDIDFSTYSPGKVHMYNMIVDSFTRGLEEFDFMNEKEDYKLLWTNDIRKRYFFAVYGKKAIGIAICNKIITRVLGLLKIIIKKGDSSKESVRTFMSRSLKA